MKMSNNSKMPEWVVGLFMLFVIFLCFPQIQSAYQTWDDITKVPSVSSYEQPEEVYVITGKHIAVGIVIIAVLCLFLGLIWFLWGGSGDGI